MAIYASVIGDVLSTAALVLLAAPLASYAVLISPVDIAAILFFALTFVAGFAGKSIIKGLLAALLGLLVSTVGLEMETAMPRMTFGITELFDGVPLVPMAIGMLAMSEMFVQASAGKANTATATAGLKADSASGIDAEDWRQSRPAILRGSLIGIAIGVLPGLGPTIGSFMSYSATRRRSKRPELFGKGAIEGVAAAESADNAVVPASLIPLFALGIPGSIIAAVLLFAMTLHGLTPGPLLFVTNPQKVYAIYGSMFMASFGLLVIGLSFSPLLAKLVSIPNSILITTVVFLCVLGSYLQGGGVFGVIVMLVFAVVGIIAKRFEFSIINFLIGFIIGPHLELSIRQALQALDRPGVDLSNYPVALLFIAASLAVIALHLLKSHKQKTLKPQSDTQNGRKVQ